MFESCREKQKQVEALFQGCDTDNARYERIIELGRKLPKLSDAYKTPENLVRGCQSQMFLHTRKEGEFLFFEAESDALISAGLAFLMISVYSGETAETILKCAPNFLIDLKISQSLSPNRANGLYSLYTRMKQDALKSLVAS